MLPLRVTAMDRDHFVEVEVTLVTIRRELIRKVSGGDVC